MERLVALVAGIAGIMAFFSTIWAISIERQLGLARKKEKANREKILEMEAKSTLVELKLSEYKERLSYFEEKEFKDQREKILSVISKARKTIKLCIPEISGNIEKAIKKAKADARLIVSEPHPQMKKAEIRISRSIDLTLVIIDDSQAYVLENNELSKLSKKKTDRAMEGFDLLWERALE